MTGNDWEHKPNSNVWFYQKPGVVWANVSHPEGALALAIVQPIGGGCKTGSFDTSIQARAWAIATVNGVA